MSLSYNISILIISLGVLCLTFGFAANLDNPDFSNTKIVISSRLSQASAFSLHYTQEDNNAKYYKTQFKIDKSQFKTAPEFTQVTGYLNTKPIKLSDLKGRVVLVHFWTYNCENCKHTIPHLNDWYEKYANKGFVIVGIHTPEFDFEKNLDNVKDAVKDFRIKYPIIQDNNYGTWNAYGNRYWPRDYLVDNEGFIRYDHVGEGGYSETENIIQSLLAEPQFNKDLNLTVTGSK